MWMDNMALLCTVVTCYMLTAKRTFARRVLEKRYLVRRALYPCRETVHFRDWLGFAPVSYYYGVPQCTYCHGSGLGLPYEKCRHRHCQSEFCTQHPLLSDEIEDQKTNILVQCCCRCLGSGYEPRAPRLTFRLRLMRMRNPQAFVKAEHQRMNERRVKEAGRNLSSDWGVIITTMGSLEVRSGYLDVIRPLTLGWVDCRAIPMGNGRLRLSVWSKEVYVPPRAWRRLSTSVEGAIQ